MLVYANAKLYNVVVPANVHKVTWIKDWLSDKGEGISCSDCSEPVLDEVFCSSCVVDRSIMMGDERYEEGLRDAAERTEG